MPSLYHNTAWLRDKTLQSKIALCSDTRFFAIDRPTLTSIFGSKYKVRVLKEKKEKRKESK